MLPVRRCLIVAALVSACAYDDSQDPKPVADAAVQDAAVADAARDASRAVDATAEAPADGGVAQGFAVEPVATGVSAAHAVLGDTLIWLEARDGKVTSLARASLPNGPRTELTAPANTVALALAGQLPYVLTTGGSVQVWEASGLRMVATVLGLASQLVGDGALIYASTSQGVYAIRVLPQLEAAKLVTDVQAPIAAGGAVYWLDGGRLNVSREGVTRALASFAGRRLSSVAELADRVVFIADRQLYAASSGGAATQLQQLDGDGPLAVSDGVIYWLDSFEGHTIRRLAAQSGEGEIVWRSADPLSPFLTPWRNGVIVGGSSQLFWLHPR